MYYTIRVIDTDASSYVSKQQSTLPPSHMIMLLQSRFFHATYYFSWRYIRKIIPKHWSEKLLKHNLSSGVNLQLGYKLEKGSQFVNLYENVNLSVQVIQNKIWQLCLNYKKVYIYNKIQTWLGLLFVLTLIINI